MSDFSMEELELVYKFIGHTVGLSINDKEISCFNDVYHLISGEWRSVSRGLLIEYIEQINLMKDAYETFGCIDCSLFEKIILFLQSMKD